MSHAHSQALDRFLEQYAFRHPVSATRAGIRLHDHELPGWSREAREDELDEFEALTVALDEEHEESPDDATLATDRHALEAHLARACMDVRQLAFESGFFEDRNPAMWIDEVLDGVQSVMTREHSGGARDETMDDVASIAMRLHEVPRFLDDLPGTITADVPVSWRTAALDTTRRVQQTLPALIDQWLSQRSVDAESVTWVREALRTALDAITAAAAHLGALPAPASNTISFGAEAYRALLSRGCSIAAEPATLRDRAQQEVDMLRTWLADALTEEDGDEARDPRIGLPAFAAATANRVGRLAVVARPSLCDALTGAWLADAWTAFGDAFCDGDGEPFDGALESIPTSAVASRLTLATRALVDLQLHTESLDLDEAADLLVETLGVTTARAAMEVVAISMTPGRAVHAWFGAHALHQTRRVLQARGVTDSTVFEVRAMTFGAIPAPLLSRLLLAT